MKIPNGLQVGKLLAMASEFDVGYDPIVNGHYAWWLKFPNDKDRYHVYVKKCGANSWGIFKDGYTTCLNKYGEWQYQPMPSNRDDGFYDSCRYSSADEAINYYCSWFDAICSWADQKDLDTPLSYLDCPCLPKLA